MSPSAPITIREESCHRLLQHNNCTCIVFYFCSFSVALQFIYAQSPENMKGLLIGIFYFIFGLFSGGGALIFHWYPSNENCLEGTTNCILWYYVIIAIIGLLGFVVYLTTAFLYTYRQRPAGYQEENEAMRRLHDGEYSSTYRVYGIRQVNFSA